MQGPSREALRAAQEASRAVAVADPQAVGQELLAVATLLGGETSLRNALTDNGSTPERRLALATQVLGGKVAQQTLSVVSSAVAQRWSRPRDLTEALEALGADALLAHAEREGRIDAVEEQLFRFTRIIESSADLQSLLSDPAIPDATKAVVTDDLLAGRAEPETMTLVGHVVAHPGGRRVRERLDELVELAAQRREQLLADVRAPVELTDDQQTRLAAALSRIYGRPVSVAVSVDPSLLGGAVVRVGDEIIDGSVASRLAVARRTLTQ
jgi:F-type H+-transporting ATPase subunit delta